MGRNTAKIGTFKKSKNREKITDTRTGCPVKAKYSKNWLEKNLQFSTGDTKHDMILEKKH